MKSYINKKKVQNQYCEAIIIAIRSLIQQNEPLTLVDIARISGLSLETMKMHLANALSDLDYKDVISIQYDEIQDMELLIAIDNLQEHQY